MCKDNEFDQMNQTSKLLHLLQHFHIALIQKMRDIAQHMLREHRRFYHKKTLGKNNMYATHTSTGKWLELQDRRSLL